MKPVHDRQHGVALITILLVVVIASVLGVSMATDQHFAINRARTFFDHGIVRQYALGGEELARQILYQDFTDSKESDHLGEAWAANDLQFEFEQGQVELLIEDLQSKINVNSLLVEGEASAEAKRRLLTLVTEQGMDQTVVDRIVDWIDTNNGVSSLGAEDYEYLGLERPYRTANRPMLDVSELRLILDMDSPSYATLSLFLTALGDVNTNINVNTASAEVLTAVAPGLSLSAAESIVAGRSLSGGYQSVNDFTADPLLAGSSQNIQNAGLSVQSNFFQVSVRARFQDRFGYLTSVIQRDPTDGTMRVVYRDHGKKILPFVTEEDLDNG